MSRHPDFEEALYYGNTFFTIVFVIEALIKIAAMSPRYYFVVRQNSVFFFFWIHTVRHMLHMTDDLCLRISGMSLTSLWLS